MIHEYEPPFIRYLYQKSIALKRPLGTTLELTTRCNFGCEMCYIHRSGCDELKEKELTTEQWKDIARQSCEEGNLFLLLTGGEPLVRDDFEEIYTYCKSLGFSVDVNTNGSLIDEKVMALFRKYPPVRLNISVYGASRDTYRRFCGNPDGFDRTWGAIKKLRGEGFQVRLSCSLTEKNLGDVEKVNEMAHEVKCPLEFATYMFPGPRTEDGGVRFTPERCAQAQYKVNLLRYGKDFLNSSVALIDSCPEISTPKSAQGMRCRGGLCTTWITWDGYMLLCGTMPEPKVSIKDHSLGEAWSIIRKESESIKMPDKCLTCKYEKLCRVCPSSCYSETGSFAEAPEYLCKRAEEYERLLREGLK